MSKSNKKCNPWLFWNKKKCSEGQPVSNPQDLQKLQELQATANNYKELATQLSQRSQALEKELVFWKEKALNFMNLHKNGNLS